MKQTKEQKNQVSRINRKFAQNGDSLKVVKSSARQISSSNLGEYHIVNTHNNTVVELNADLDQLEKDNNTLSAPFEEAAKIAVQGAVSLYRAQSKVTKRFLSFPQNQFSYVKGTKEDHKK